MLFYKVNLPNYFKYYFMVCLFVFLALQPIVVVFSQTGSGLWPPRLCYGTVQPIISSHILRTQI
jgi:hypothetical protein